MKRNNYILKIILYLILLFVFSLLSIYSAKTISLDNLGNIFIKQIIYYIIGVIVLIIAYRYKNIIIKYAYLWYIGLNFLLSILLFLGISINGSKCWLFIGPFSFQPSEFMKIALVIVTAKILSKYKKKETLKKEFIMLLKVFSLFFIPAILTLLEPDTGVVIIYFITIISMILIHGINKKWYYYLTILTIVIGTISLYFYHFHHDTLINLLGNNVFYRIERILNWSNGNGYQLENSLIAIGSAGILGFGFNHIPLYFPESSTDFIFTSLSSNYGFIGSIIFIVILIFFDKTLLSGCNYKVKKTDKYLLMGFFSMILYQQIQNIGMTIGLLPITGITLPFISYGGSSLISYMFITGIIIRILKDKSLFFN